MIAKPMRIKERKKKTPDKMMEHFLPAQLREREDRLLPSMAPMGGRDTANNGKLKTYSTISPVSPIQEQVSGSSGAVTSTCGLVLFPASFRLGRPVEAQALTRPIQR